MAMIMFKVTFLFKQKVYVVTGYSRVMLELGLELVFDKIYQYIIS